ncbi:MAG: type II toxin-antitoxin system RelB/DinJ family antitoxin [Gemmatimonadaceae bacterium]|nr:type II toxin-antitoxin system RelB/DinJ family antitoxin [Acetobacteraceae bacterium]
MATTGMLHVQIDEDTKERATLALSKVGLSMPDAVRLFLTRVAADQAFSLALVEPNATTRSAMIEARMIGQARFLTAAKLFDDLDTPGQ